MVLSTDEIRTQVAALGPWFHNLDLNGVMTAPDHFLGDYPRAKWNGFSDALPANLSGRSVLDIGCNAGFYSLEMKKRGAARVLGIDFDKAYLRQARFAAAICGLDVEFRNMSVYDIASVGQRFDIVLFMGVLYHLRHPLLALDLIRDHVVGDLMLFQCMLRGSTQVEPIPEDVDFFDTRLFDRADYPKLHFIEHRYAHDPTNWWTPNQACVEAMLRSSGFEITDHLKDDVYLCRCAGAPAGEGAVYPARGKT